MPTLAQYDTWGGRSTTRFNGSASGSPGRLRLNLNIAQKWDKVVDALSKCPDKVPLSVAIEAAPRGPDGKPTGGGDRTLVKYTSYGLPRDPTVADVVNRLEASSRAHDYNSVSRFQIIFRDGSQMTFRRLKNFDGWSLRCTTFFEPPRPPKPYDADLTSPKRMSPRKTGALRPLPTLKEAARPWLSPGYQ